MRRLLPPRGSSCELSLVQEEVVGPSFIGRAATATTPAAATGRGDGRGRAAAAATAARKGRSRWWCRCEEESWSRTQLLAVQGEDVQEQELPIESGMLIWMIS